jgi:hypothetical protein
MAIGTTRSNQRAAEGKLFIYCLTLPKTDALRPYKSDPELDWAGGRAMTLRPCLVCKRLVDKWDANGLCDPCHDDLQRDLEEIEDDLIESLDDEPMEGTE